jgi:predicted dehydrogenase
MSMLADPHFLVVGAGAIALRHIAILKRLVPGARFTVWRRQAIPCGDEIAVVHGLAAALDRKPTAAIVASPASDHVATAMALAEAGLDLFVEKPLAATLDGVDELLESCAARRIVLQVGYCFRFSPGFTALGRLLAAGTVGRPLHLRATVGQYLPDWRPDRDYRTSVSAQAAHGGGAVLELSHEFDYVQALLGEAEAVTARTRRSGTLEIDAEDCADAVVEFAGGAIANIHLDMLSRPAERRCRIVGTLGTVEWDLLAGTVRAFRAIGGTWEEVDATASEDMYTRQMRDFLDCIATRRKPLVSGHDGRRSLALALAAKRAAAERRTLAA